MECEKCGFELDIDLNSLEYENNGSSGNHTTSFTYYGTLSCSNCSYDNEVTIDTDECDDTGEILIIESR